MIKRLFLLLALALCAAAHSAQAEAPVTKFRPSSVAFPSTVYPLVDTQQDGCNVALSEWTRGGNKNFTSAAFVNSACRCYSGTYFDVCGSSNPVSICPDGKLPDTGKPLQQQCGPVAPDCSNKTPFSAYQEFADKAAAMNNTKIPLQVAWCKIDVQKMELNKCVQVVETGKFRCYWTVQNTGDVGTAQDKTTAAGNPSTADTAAPSQAVAQQANTPADKCPSGTVSGGTTQDGMAICVGTGTGPKAASTDPTKTTAPTITKDNGDGTKTTTTTSSVKNADGSTTTVTTTTNTAADGTQTTGQTATTSSNTAGKPGQYDDPKDKDDLCKRNPLLNICKNSAVTGTCEATACEGDAIQCATLRAAAAMQCKQKADDKEARDSSAYTLGNALANGVDPQAGALPSKSNGQQITMASSLDTSGWLGGGSCFADKTFVVQGRSIVLPLSKSCQYLVGLRYALMVVASLVSLRILSSAVLT